MMVKNLQPVGIRAEAALDADAIEKVTASAFLDAVHSSHTEQFIVKALREAGVLSVSLVAEVGGEIVGHVAISPVTISDGSGDWYGLGPISVLPAWQGKGIGSRLMEQGLAALRGLGAAGCVVLGEPGYYGRFGFRAQAGLVLPEVPSEYFQALLLGGPGDVFPEGTVSYHEAFGVRRS